MADADAETFPSGLAFGSSLSKVGTPPPPFSFVFGSTSPEKSPEQKTNKAKKHDATCKSKKSDARSNPTDFEALMKQHIRPLIELNDQINALTSEERTINSARIVVAGDQSHGKTSLLEALSGVDLPRGEGIQTRVPLVLQLREAKDKDEHALIKISSSNVKPERIGLGEIGAKVKEYTAQAAGEGKDVRDEPIELKIFRRDQDDLTLVDLPGITRVALNDQAGGNGRKLEELILGMCKHYMEPEQSILLNVVSAMVDFSTSASLQLSRELDPKGLRTMLCITKVDQHREDGLNDKIDTAMQLMELSPDHVFAVRNRSQMENDNALSLHEVRHAEMFELKRLSQRDSPGYGLGVAALSKQLVKIQHEQILQTLPRARTAIRQQISDLEGRLDKLGKPVGDSVACRAKALQLIEACMNQLQDEVAGRAAHVSTDVVSCEGASLEISLVVEDLASLRKKDCETEVLEERKSVGGYIFELSVYPRDNNVEDENAKPVGIYLEIVPPSGIKIKSMKVECSFMAESEDTGVNERKLESDFAEYIKRATGLGSTSVLSVAQAKKVKSPITFSANVFVEKVEFESVPGEEPGTTAMLLCAHLNNLQDELVSGVDSLYSNRHFFSGAFRKSLAREVAACRGGVGLPGVIAQHVPVNVLKTLRLKLPAVVDKYRSDVLKACNEKAKDIVARHVEHKLHPKLQELMIDECANIFERQASALVGHHDLILEWEDSICSSNHYFMDTVQSIRSSISDSEEENKPAYLKHLSDSKIRAMSNEDQRLVDMQIEIFAYWKLMKKRLVDYIIMSTYAGLVNKPINSMLKTSLMEAAFRHKDEELVKIMSPNASVVRERTSLATRLERLGKARDYLNDHDRMMGVVV